MSNIEKTSSIVLGTPPKHLVRLSYAHIFEPKAGMSGGDPKYSVSVIISKDDVDTVKRVKAAIAYTIESQIAKFKDGKVPPMARLKNPLRDGDDERPDDEAYKNSYFINANSPRRPSIVDKNFVQILDTEEVYSGCYGLVSVNFYVYNVSGSQGVACGLSNIMKVKDGDRLGGNFVSAEKAFENLDLGEDDDLM